MYDVDKKRIIKRKRSFEYKDMDDAEKITVCIWKSINVEDLREDQGRHRIYK